MLLKTKISANGKEIFPRSFLTLVFLAQTFHSSLVCLFLSFSLFTTFFLFSVSQISLSTRYLGWHPHYYKTRNDCVYKWYWQEKGLKNDKQRSKNTMKITKRWRTKRQLSSLGDAKAMEKIHFLFFWENCLLLLKEADWLPINLVKTISLSLTHRLPYLLLPSSPHHTDALHPIKTQPIYFSWCWRHQFFSLSGSLGKKINWRFVNKKTKDKTIRKKNPRSN